MGVYRTFDPVLWSCRWNGPDRTSSTCRHDSTQLHRKQPPETCEKKFERHSTVGSIDTDLWTRYSSPVGGTAPTERRRCVVQIPRNSIENSLRKLVKKFDCDSMVGSIDTELLTRYSGLVGEMAPTGRRRRVVKIRCYSIENSLLKLVKQNLSAIQRSDL